MCAAPGGKSLLIAWQMFGHNREGRTGRLVCNDISKERLSRLKEVFKCHPPPVNNSSIQYTCCDGGNNNSTLARYGPYDRILVDAPCSSDRHLLHGGIASLSKWTTACPKNNALRQVSLLLSALKLVRRGGKVLYITCALSDCENDQVISKVIEGSRGNATVVPIVSRQLARTLKISVYGNLAQSESSGYIDETVELESMDYQWYLEATKYGAQILPDNGGHGPLYLCMLEKV